MWGISCQSQDGSEFQFEANQYDFPTTWSTSHVGHFYWSNSVEVACAYDYAYAEDDQRVSASDELFTNDTETTAKCDFTVNGVTGLYRTLSIEEWKYLINTRTVNGGTGIDKTYSHHITYGDKLGLVLYPDNYTGDPLSGTVETLPQGVVFLPAAGERGSDFGVEYLNRATYWSSSKPYFYDDWYWAGKFFYIIFNNNNYYPDSIDFIEEAQLNFGSSIRLVTDVK